MKNESIVTPEADIMRFVAHSEGQRFKIFTETNIDAGKLLDIAVLSGVEGIESAHFDDDAIYGYGVVVSKRPGYGWYDFDSTDIAGDAAKCNLLDKCLEAIASSFGKKPYLTNLEDYYG